MTNFNKVFNYNYHYVRILIKYIRLLWKNQEGRQTTTPRMVERSSLAITISFQLQWEIHRMRTTYSLHPLHSSNCHDLFLLLALSLESPPSSSSLLYSFSSFFVSLSS